MVRSKYARCHQPVRVGAFEFSGCFLFINCSSFGGDTTLCYTNNNGTASVWSHHFLPTAGRTLSSSTPTSTPTWTFTWDATNPSVPDGGTMEITYDGTNWSINNDSLEPDFATHATISATAVANSIAIGYYDFGAWVNGWSFPNTYTSGDVPASVISGSWASSFVSMIQQGS